MLYAALIFWLFVIIFAAWAVHALLSRLIKPKIVNAILLPGTLVATLGHVFGLLITGNEVRRTSLIGDAESGEPQSEAPETHRIPILGSVVVGLMPILACSVALIVAIKYWGVKVYLGAAGMSIMQELPLTPELVFRLLEQGVQSAEVMYHSLERANLMNWQTLLFLYLAICLTVRMAPFRGHQRGAVIAIALAGLLIWLLGLITNQVRDFVTDSWWILSFVVSLLMLLLIFSLVLAGIVGFVRLLARR